MRVLIEGIGGVGGVIATRLLGAGHTPTLVTGNTSIRDAINAHGLRVKIPGGRTDIAASASLDELNSEDGKRTVGAANMDDLLRLL